MYAARILIRITFYSVLPLHHRDIIFGGERVYSKSNPFQDPAAFKAVAARLSASLSVIINRIVVLLQELNLLGLLRRQIVNQ